MCRMKKRVICGKGADDMSELTTLNHWMDWAKAYASLPYVTVYPLDEVSTWEPVWEASSSPHTILLESGKGGRYTFLGVCPEVVIEGKGERARLQTLDEQGHWRWSEDEAGAPLEVVKRWMDRCGQAPRVEGAPRFLGGLAGYWGYDVARSIERLPAVAVDDLQLPDYVFLQLNKLYSIDHLEGRLYISVMKRTPSADQTLDALYEQARREAFDMYQDWTRWMALSSTSNQAGGRKKAWEAIPSSDRLQLDIAQWEDVYRDFPEAEYQDAVRKIQAYISAGDVFQVNLSLRQHRHLLSQPSSIYEWLRIVNPSPYMAYLRMPEFEVVSGSPELLVKLEREVVSTRPIAGTRRRGLDSDEEEQFIRELKENEKEIAEHIMLVDLLRNDLGRISEYGSVHVSELMTIEAYSHVMHLVSQVEGRLAYGVNGFDVIKAAFPGGTITGAPKIRTMEIIEELEPVRRGLYTGSIGWIDYSGDMEFNIVIRTLVAKEGMGYIQAGAGIVIDSSPEREYKESLNKAKALWKAIELSEREDAR